MKKPIVSWGRIWFQPPNKFRREVKGSSPSITVSDGRQLWIYYPNFKSAERYPLGKGSPLDATVTAINSALNLENIETSFNISSTKNDNGYQLALLPRTAAMKRVFQKLDLRINDKFRVERTDMLLPNGDRIVTFFADAPVDLREVVRSSKHIRVGAMLEEPQARDARSGRLASFHGEHWIAAGDAALSFDPLSSQGIYAAQYSGKKAAETLISGRFSEYDARMNELWERFLDNRAAMYTQEQRWSDRPFWRARAQR
jgi:hypothetical protein